MNDSSLLDAAFTHHVWATIALIDSSAELSPQDLQHVVPGTRGPIIETLAHIVDADSWDLAILEGRSLAEVEDVVPEPDALRDAMHQHGSRWATFLERSFDPTTMVTEVDPTDGFRRVASIGMRLASTLDHGSDHRSQICTALTTLGLRPPTIDVMTFGVATGRVEETAGMS